MRPLPRHVPSANALSPSDTADAEILRLEQENRWLKRYLGETLKELHLLQAHLYGKSVH